ncbi:MAG TPA: DoxX family protein [Rugosimonospora sp.]|nr:DoxX family protein [Rugosimonospora sp.]
MNIFLWVLQILTAVAFVGAGSMKLIQPKEKLQPRMAYVEDFSANAIKGIGAAEVLAALGLILPWATGIAKVLTPLAAAGLVIVMIGAVVVHVRRKENNQLGVPLILLILALIVAIGRFADL